MDTYGTATKSNNELLDIINKNFDLRPGMIIKFVLKILITDSFSHSFYRELNLRQPIYQKTAAYGHFGRDEFSWEKPKKLQF